MHRRKNMSDLEYANQIWFPHRVPDLDRIEKVQKRGTKIVLRGKNMSYEQHLQLLNFQPCIIGVFEVI